MRGLNRLQRLFKLVLAGGTVAGCAMAVAPADWRNWDLGAFSMRAPTHLRLEAGGIDSQAGALTADGMRIDYDFGLYADPLNRRADTLDYQSHTGSVDGLAARFVRFRLGAANDPAVRTCAGVHVPGVRRSGMGPLALTVLACAASADGLRDAPAMFDSIRWQGAVAR